MKIPPVKPMTDKFTTKQITMKDIKDFAKSVKPDGKQSSVWIKIEQKLLKNKSGDSDLY